MRSWAFNNELRSTDSVRWVVWRRKISMTVSRHAGVSSGRLPNKTRCLALQIEHSG